MRRVVAGVATLALMVLLLWSGMRRGGSPAGAAPDAVATAPDPYEDAEARVRALLAGARDGDVSAYLAAFVGPLRDRLEREVRERGADAFATDLRRAAAARKGHAVFAPEPDGPDAARITVEAIYPDRNERQTYRLERGPDGWRVAAVETVRSRTPAAKFGTPAQYQEPEGPPVEPIGPGPQPDDPGNAPQRTQPRGERP
jgi:hypothetical protein